MNGPRVMRISEDGNGLFIGFHMLKAFSLCPTYECVGVLSLNTLYLDLDWFRYESGNNQND